MLQFDIVTIFPEIFTPYFNTSILKRAQEKGLIKIQAHDLRRWTEDRHKTVDDKPYGGGPGMILKIEPLVKAIQELKLPEEKKTEVILLTPQGETFRQETAYSLSRARQIILLCGRYEGVDARIENFIDRKISVGSYVLTGGEIPAMMIVDAVARLVPQVIKTESLAEESFSFDSPGGEMTEYPQYTRPEVFTYKNKSGKLIKLSVPEILLSGDHRKIKEWKKKQRKDN